MVLRARSRPTPLGDALSRVVSALVVGLLVVGCAGAPGPTPSGSSDGSGRSYPGWPIGPVSGLAVVPTIVNAPGELAVGPSRFLFSLLDPRSGAPLADPSITARLEFFDLAKDPAHPATTTQGTFVWAIQGQVGLYHAAVDLPASGDWGVQLDLRGGKAGADTTVRLQFDVAAHSSTPAVGEAVPAIDTPTATTSDAIRRISTDPDPDPAFYAVSESQALAAHTPFVLVIATPKFCTSRICGPTLDHVKALAPAYLATVDFIHVEPYVLRWTGTDLQPVLDAQGDLQLLPALAPLHLLSEPWVFVVGADGRLVAKFEGAFGDDELRAALARAGGG